MSSGLFDSTELSLTASSAKFCHMSSGWFDLTDFLEPHVSEFGVVRLYRTFSSYSVTGCAGCFGQEAGCRTFSN